MRSPIEILNTIQRESSIVEIKDLKQAMINYNYGAVISEPFSPEEMDNTLKFFHISNNEDLEFDLIEPNKFYNLNAQQQKVFSNDINQLFKDNDEKIFSIILFSNPNSGKTKYLNTLIENFPQMNLSLKNLSNKSEWQEKLFIQNIAGKSFFGSILKMIANSSIYYEVPNFIYEDEVGEFELDFFLGQTLKGIFKSEQRINIAHIIANNAVLRNKFEEIKLNKKITLNQYIEIGNILQSIFSYEMTTYQYNEFEIPLWLPDNLYFIFGSNYEIGMEKSLRDSKGWGKKGKRFYPKHFYNCGNIKNNELVQIESEHISKVIIDFNEQFLNSFNKILELPSLSLEDKEDLKSKKYEFLAPNFYQFDSKIESEQREELKERLKSLIYDFSFQDPESIFKLLVT